MNRRRLLKRLSQGALRNVAFNDMISLAPLRLIERYNLKLEDEK